MIRQFFRHVVPGILKPLRVLWNEIIGFLFIVLAILGMFRAWREFQDNMNPVTVVLPLIWTVVMTFFGVTSFMRARRISRS